MKKEILLASAAFFMTLCSKSQCIITENSFENWTFQQYNTVNGPITANTPDGWTPLVSQFQMALTGTQPGFMQQPTDAYSGTTSLQLYADASGTYLDGGDLMNISACNTDPSVLYAYHKFEGWTPGDTAIIMAFAIDYSSGTGDTIGVGVTKLAAEVMSWSAVTIPITYSGSGADSLSIYVSFFPTNPTQPKRFKVDHFTFQTPSVVGDSHWMNEISVYPNPFNEKLTVSGLEKGDKINVLDISGRLLETYIATGMHQSLFQTGTNSGVYLIEVVRNARVYVTRVIKN